MAREIYQRGFGDEVVRPTALELGKACTAAGQWALDKGDREVARELLLAARVHERSAVAISSDPGWKWLLDEANAWRKPLAETSRNLFMNAGDWEAAENENGLLLEIGPSDQIALDWKLKFENSRLQKAQRRDEALQLSRITTQAQALHGL